MAKVKIKTKKKSNNGVAFVFGSLLGGLIGAAATLWKTPQTGEQLRSKVTGSLPSIGGNSSTLNFSTSPATEEHSKAPGEATGEPTASGIGHVATTEELLRPPSVTAEA